MSERVKQTAQEEATRIRDLSVEAAKSQAYLYPLRGIFYFATHRALWKPLGAKLIPTLTLGVSILAGMFFFTYLPQAALMALFEGPLAAVSTVLLVLSESSTIFNVMARNFLVEESLIDTFDGTLVAKDMTTLVEKGRQVKSGTDPIYKLGKMVKQPFAKFAPSAIIRYFMYLPLNFIPVIGTVLFVLLQGKRFGPSAHARYFQLKGLSEKERNDFVEQRRGAYTSFGVAANLLELVPMAGIFFAFTNQVGAALWAADLERSSTTAPGLRETAKKAE